MVNRVRWRLVAVAVCALVAGTSRQAAAHPLHTTLTRVTLEPSRRSVQFMVRAFADDYLTAVSRGQRSVTRPAIDGPEALAYARSAFTATFDGKPLLLRSCGTRPAGEVVWVCLEADAPKDASRLAVRSQFLCELFSDQINIVQSAITSTPRSILFTRGDRAKPLG